MAGKLTGVVNTALDCLHWLIKRETVVVLSKFQIVRVGQILKIRNLIFFLMLIKTAVNSTENTQRLNYSCKSVNTIKERNQCLRLKVKSANTLCEKNAKCVSTPN